MSLSVWMLLIASLPTQAYSPLQLKYLDARKPWVVPDAAGIGVSLHLKSPAYGYRMVFRETISVDGRTQEHSQNIFAVPREEKIYWLNSKQLAEFENLGPGIISETVGGDRICIQTLIILIVLLMLAFCSLRNYSFEQR